MNSVSKPTLLKISSFIIAGFLFAGSLRAETRVIDLADSLRLADERNAELAIAVERSKQAAIESQQSWLQWLPTLRYGTSFAHQDGLLQETDGNLLDAERNGRFDGFGSGGIGAGLTSRPGLALEIDTAEAVFGISLQKQKRIAAEARTESERLQIMLRVSEAYYDLAKAERNLQLSQRAVANAEELSKITRDYADAGEGLIADAERAGVEALLQQQNLENARFAQAEAAAKLNALLQLGADVELKTDGNTIAPLNLPGLSSDLEQLLATARSQRPEIRSTIADRKAVEAANRETSLSPLFPNVGASYSDTDFGGGVGSNNNLESSREETTFAIYWELDQLGLGSLNKSRIQKSKLRQAEAMERHAEAQIEASVIQAYTRWKATEKQLDLARAMVDSARKSYELSRERVFENQGLPLEAMQAMQALAQAETNYVVVVARYNLSQIALKAAIGEAAQ